MKKLPAIQFYPGDWKKDLGVQCLNLEERGAWWEILMLMHDSEERGKLLLNGRPFPTEELAMLLHSTPERIKQILSKLEALGVATVEQTTGALVNRRMLRDEELRARLAKAGAIGGSTTQARRKARSTSSSSSSATAKHNPSGYVSPEVTRGVTPGQTPEILKGLKLYQGDERLLRRWEELTKTWGEAYPGVSLGLELRRAHAWEMSNPKRRKKDHARFLNTWLARAQDQAARSVNGKPFVPAVAAPKKPPCETCGDRGVLSKKGTHPRDPGRVVDIAYPCPTCRPAPAEA